MKYKHVEMPQDIWTLLLQFMKETVNGERLKASIFVTITVLLWLYAHKYKGKSGECLNKQQPYEHRNYCIFNYGLPYTFKMSRVRVYRSPESGNYRVILNAISGNAYANYSKYDAVTYATQATPEYVHHIVEIARYWDGPISLSVYVPGFDLDITMQIMNHLCHCYPGMAKVSVHLFFSKHFPPKLRTKNQMTVTTKTSMKTTAFLVEDVIRKKLDSYRKLNNKTRAEYIQWARRKKEWNMLEWPPKRSFAPILRFKSCSSLTPYNNVLTFRQEQNLVYPINVGRNVARYASKTNYFIVSDIEMVPSDRLAPKFLTMMRKIMGDKRRDEGCVFAKTVFVVPLFEVGRGEKIPRDKNTLVPMVKANRAMYFHRKICPACQRFPGLQSWLQRPSPKDIEPMLRTKRQYPFHRWEPLYFGTHKDPWYSEMFSWEGRADKMTQVLELCIQSYHFVIIDGGFLCHAARKAGQTKKSVKQTMLKRRAYAINMLLYSTTVRNFKKKYNKYLVRRRCAN